MQQTLGRLRQRPVLGGRNLVHLGIILMGAFLLHPPELSAQDSTITDPRDGHTYPVIKIGDTWWFARNLDHDQEGSVAANGPEDGCSDWGRLYGEDASRNACPTGWRLPAPDDWEALSTLDVYALMDTLCWESRASNTNASGLTLQPSGYTHRDEHWNRRLSSAIWFHDPTDRRSHWHLHVHGDNGDTTHVFHTHKQDVRVRRFAVRCVRPAQGR